MTSGSAWEAELASAFAVLLGRPLDDFDPTATYALYYWDDAMSAEFFDQFDPASVGSVLPSAPPRADFDPIVWGLDLGRSVFLFGAGDRLTTGRDLVGRRFDPTAEYLRVLVRAHTDGSLFAAMRAATWTLGPGPADLVAFGVGAVVAEMWERPLAGIAHDGLRDHLRMMCLNDHCAADRGAFYSGTAECPGELVWLARRPGHAFVTGWTFGAGQAASAIFRVPA